MLKRRLLTTIAVIFIVIVFITFLLGEYKTVAEWLRDQWLDLFYATVMALTAGIIIHYIYIKIVPKPVTLQNTEYKKPPELNEPRKIVAKLILPNNNEIKITKDEKIFGREDFVGVVSSDDLLFIGRRHFKIIRMDDRLYIQDLDTKNGTKLNGEEIKGLGRRELKGGDEILVAKALKIRCVAETS